jgi:hypothetical protein
MTSSQRKTVLFLERLLHTAYEGQRSVIYVSHARPAHDVRADMHVGRARVGVAKITPLGRPYWSDEESSTHDTTQ